MAQHLRSPNRVVAWHAFVTKVGSPQTQPLSWFAAAWLSAHAVACEHGDIVLGARGGSPAPASAQRDGGAQRPTRSSSPAAISDSDTMNIQPTGGMAAKVDAAVAGADSGSVAPVPASAGCGKEPRPLAASASNNGARASFLLDVPADYDNTHPYPLVLAFRGMNRTVEQFRAELDLESVSADAVIRVHPNPVDDATVWDFQRDMPWVDMLLSALSAEYCVDQERIFAIGDGAGALFTNLVGCVRADKVRGIALLASAPPAPPPCTGRAAAWLLQQTDGDPMLVSAGLGNRDVWLSRNACDLNPPEPETTNGCLRYTGCSAEYPVEYCEHAGDALPAFAVTEAWEFFSSL